MDFTTLFGADKILLEDIDKLQSNTPDIIIWAAPVMFFFVLIEYIISYYQNRKFYEKKETFGSIWSWKRMLLLWLASIVPFGTFYADYKMLRYDQEGRPGVSG